MIGYGFSSLFGNTLAGINGRTSKQLIAVSRTIGEGLAPDRTRRMFQAVGEHAQAEVLSAYDQKVGGSGDYRKNPRAQRNKRYAGGALRAALASSQFFEADAHGLRFANFDLLSRRAKQWRRLNFGAGVPGVEARFGVRWSNVVVETIGFDVEPAEAFRIPRGYWVNNGQGVAPGEGRGDAFYPVSERPANLRGAVLAGAAMGRIQARSFLEAGAEEIADQLPRGFELLYRDLFAEAQRAGEAVDTTVLGHLGIGVRPSRLIKSEFDRVFRV